MPNKAGFVVVAILGASQLLILLLFLCLEPTNGTIISQHKSTDNGAIFRDRLLRTKRDSAKTHKTSTTTSRPATTSTTSKPARAGSTTPQPASTTSTPALTSTTMQPPSPPPPPPSPSPSPPPPPPSPPSPSPSTSTKRPRVKLIKSTTAKPPKSTATTPMAADTTTTAMPSRTTPEASMTSGQAQKSVYGGESASDESAPATSADDSQPDDIFVSSASSDGENGDAILAITDSRTGDIESPQSTTSTTRPEDDSTITTSTSEPEMSSRADSNGQQDDDDSSRGSLDDEAEFAVTGNNLEERSGLAYQANHPSLKPGMRAPRPNIPAPPNWNKKIEKERNRNVSTSLAGWLTTTTFKPAPTFPAMTQKSPPNRPPMPGRPKFLPTRPPSTFSPEPRPKTSQPVIRPLPSLPPYPKYIPRPPRRPRLGQPRRPGANPRGRRPRKGQPVETVFEKKFRRLRKRKKASRNGLAPQNAARRRRKGLGGQRMKLAYGAELADNHLEPVAPIVPELTPNAEPIPLIIPKEEPTVNTTTTYVNSAADDWPVSKVQATETSDIQALPEIADWDRARDRLKDQSIPSDGATSKLLTALARRFSEPANTGATSSRWKQFIAQGLDQIIYGLAASELFTTTSTVKKVEVDTSKPSAPQANVTIAAALDTAPNTALEIGPLAVGAPSTAPITSRQTPSDSQVHEPSLMAGIDFSRTSRGGKIPQPSSTTSTKKPADDSTAHSTASPGHAQSASKPSAKPSVSPAPSSSAPVSHSTESPTNKPIASSQEQTPSGATGKPSNPLPASSTETPSTTGPISVSLKQAASSTGTKIPIAIVSTASPVAATSPLSTNLPTTQPTLIMTTSGKGGQLALAGNYAGASSGLAATTPNQVANVDDTDEPPIMRVPPVGISLRHGPSRRRLITGGTLSTGKRRRQEVAVQSEPKRGRFQGRRGRQGFARQPSHKRRPSLLQRVGKRVNSILINTSQRRRNPRKKITVGRSKTRDEPQQLIDSQDDDVDINEEADEDIENNENSVDNLNDNDEYDFTDYSLDTNQKDRISPATTKQKKVTASSYRTSSEGNLGAGDDDQQQTDQQVQQQVDYDSGPNEDNTIQDDLDDEDSDQSTVIDRKSIVVRPSNKARHSEVRQAKSRINQQHRRGHTNRKGMRTNFQMIAGGEAARANDDDY